jgi:Replication protein
MTCYQQNHRLQIYKIYYILGKDTKVFEDVNIDVFAPSFNTLAQLGTDPKNSLKSRAKSKFFGDALSIRLADVSGTILKKSYWNSYYCNKILEQRDGKITARYCNNRWCTVCNRIRIAKLVNGYKTPLAALVNPQFVTLTVPNCSGCCLRETIIGMQDVFKAILETIKRRRQRGTASYQIVGMRKIECTFNAIRGDYHPHFHLIVQGYDAASELLTQWLARFPSTSVKAQDIRPVAEGSEIELFKYFTKIVTKTGKGDYRIFVKELDVMFTAMAGLRVFQPIGLKKEISEDIDALQSQLIDGLADDGYLEWHVQDWYYINGGECLTSYEPSDGMKTLVTSFVT